MNDPHDPLPLAAQLPTHRLSLPRPVPLIARTALVSAVVLFGAYSMRRALVEPLLPLVAASMSWLDGNFQVLGVDIAHNGPNEVVRVKANLAHPVYVGTHQVKPFATVPRLAGWYQINLPVAYIFAHCLLVLIIILAWPVSRPAIYAIRMCAALPMMALLLLIDVPVTILAELWSPLHDDFQPFAFWPLLAWSRFMMGGGGFMIAAVMGIATLRISAATVRS